MAEVVRVTVDAAARLRDGLDVADVPVDVEADLKVEVVFGVSVDPA